MRESVRRLIFRNRSLKLLSLVLATGLWFAITSEPVAEIEITVPIEFHNVPAALEISSEKIPQAQIRLRGPARLMHQLRPADVRTAVDLAGVRPGERTVDLTSRMVQAPRELTVVQIVPSQVRLAFDQRQTREVEIRPRVVGEFAAGYRIARVEADPPRITITGPKHHVEAVEAAITDPIDASGTMVRSSFFTHAYVSDPLVQVVNPAPVRVTVIMEKIAP
jgi:YbbR domain-containing protein